MQIVIKNKNESTSTASIKQKQKESNTDSQKNEVEFFNKNGEKITNPVFVEFLQKYKTNWRDLPAAAKMRYQKIKKLGDDCPPSTLAACLKFANPDSIKKNAKTDINDIFAQNAKQDITQDVADQVINDIYAGNDPISACKAHRVTYHNFLKSLNKVEFKKQKEEFLNARVLFADSLIYRVFELQKKLEKGLIDNCTYSNLSRDLILLAGKFAPQTFGDKIQVESKSTSTTVHTIDSRAIARLNGMLSVNAIDADFQIEDKTS